MKNDENTCISEWKRLKSHFPQLTLHVVIINKILITIKNVKKLIQTEPRLRSTPSGTSARQQRSSADNNNTVTC